VLTRVAVRSGEALSEDAAFEIAAEGSLDMGRRCFTALSAGEFQPGFELGLEDAIPQRPLGTAAVTATALSYWPKSLATACRVLSIFSKLYLRQDSAVSAPSTLRAGTVAIVPVLPLVLLRSAQPPSGGLASFSKPGMSRSRCQSSPSMCNPSCPVLHLAKT